MDYPVLMAVGEAMLFAGLALPLIWRKVPMNSSYGFRVRVSFRSEADWYEINEYGGKCLLIATLPLLLAGLWAQLTAITNVDLKLGVVTTVMLISLVSSTLVAMVKARKMEARGVAS